MTISIIISVDEDIVRIYNDENVELFGKDLVNISLEACWYICQPKWHHLVLVVVISSLKRRFLFVPLTDFHLMICTDKVDLNKLPNSS